MNLKALQIRQNEQKKLEVLEAQIAVANIGIKIHSEMMEVMVKTQFELGVPFPTSERAPTLADALKEATKDAIESNEAIKKIRADIAELNVQIEEQKAIMARAEASEAAAAP